MTAVVTESSPFVLSGFSLQLARANFGHNVLGERFVRPAICCQRNAVVLVLIAASDLLLCWGTACEAGRCPLF